MYRGDILFDLLAFEHGLDLQIERVDDLARAGLRGRIAAAVNPAAPDSTPRRDKNSGWSHVHSLLRACFAASVGNERRGSKRTTWRRWAWCKVEFVAGGIWRRIILPGHPIASGVPRMRRSAPSLRRGALLIQGPCGAWVPALRSSASRCAASGTRAALVPRHSDYDWLILSQSRMGKSSGAIRIWMLRATPG